MKTKTKYDPLIPWLYSIEKEELLPKSFRKTIARSTIAQWRQNENERLYGHQFRHIFKDSLSYLEVLNEKKKLEKILRNLAKSWLLLSSEILPYFEKTKEKKILFIDELQRLCQVLPRNIVLKLAKMSLPKYRRHLDSLKLTCYNSPIDMCVKTNSHQISKGELIRIKKLVTSIDYACWPKSSIYYDAVRKGKLKICLATFYKYAAMFENPNFYSRKIERRQGAITKQPNEKVHLDTTFWPLKNGKKAAIVFMSDNYSRAIIGYNVADQKNAENVKGAIRSGIQTIKKFHPNHLCPVELVTDGGTENHNKTINDLLKEQKDPRLHKVIAKKDVSFSNSPIEAVNKVMKKYLRYHQPDTLEALHKLVPVIVTDYMDRPHGSLKGLSPLERYQNFEFLNFSSTIKQGRVQRFKDNKKNICKTCAYKSKCSNDGNSC